LSPKLISILLCAVLLPACGASDDDDSAPSAPTEWDSSLVVSGVDTGEIGAVSYSSSSQLRVAWTAPPEDYDQIRLEVTDLSTGLAHAETAGTVQNSHPLTNLKAATTYSVSIMACATDVCDEGLDGGVANGQTADEVWQLLGTGHNLDGLTNIVADSNAKAHAFVYGESAPVELRGRIQLYYGAMGGFGGSLSVATSNRAADADDESSYSDFTSHVGNSGVVEPEAGTPLVEWIGTGQGVPLSDELGGGVRLFFEARGSDATTRLLSLDSEDGYRGRDFNSGPAEYCSLASDYEEGGGCHPAVEIGAAGDEVAPATGIDNVRQQKVGVPTLESWRWGGNAGTFMVFTTGAVNGCSDSQKNHGYAVYDGNTWSVQYAASGCPKLFEGVQAMAPLDLGEGRFKIQFGNPDETEGALGSNLPFLGPKRIIYGDAARSGDPAVLDFEDWDSVDEARDLTFLWPDGEVFDATEEGYIDDFVVLTPTFDVDHQVQFVVLTDGARIPFTSAAILRNR
jgi:hypothetical protein